MAQTRGIIYMTEGLARVLCVSDGVTAEREQQMRLKRSPDDIRDFTGFLKEQRFSPERLILCLPRTMVCVRFLSFPAHGDAELRKMAGYELNTLFPERPEEFVSDYAVVERAANGTPRVMMAAVRRQVLLRHLDFIKWSGARPDEVWVSTQALQRAFLKEQRPGPVCLAHVDDGFVEILFFRDRTLLYGRAMSLADYRSGDTLAMKEMLSAGGYVCERVFAGGDTERGKAFLGRFCRDMGCAMEAIPGFSLLDGISVPDEAGPAIDLLPCELKEDRSSARRRKHSLSLAAVILLNVVLGANLYFVRQSAKREYCARLDAMIKAADSRTLVLQKKLAAVRAYEHTAGSGERKMGVLAALAASCPGDVFLSSLDIAGEGREGTLAASGKAKDADTVLRFAAALKGDPLITKTDVSFINKRPDSGGWVDFEIKAAY